MIAEGAQHSKTTEKSAMISAIHGRKMNNM